MASSRNTKAHKFLFSLLAILILTTITIPLKQNTTTQIKLSRIRRPNSENSLKIFCSVTQDAQLCFTSISAHGTAAENPTPDELFTAALEVAAANISSLPPLSRGVLAAGSAEEDHCERGFRDSVSQLNRVWNESQTYPRERSYLVLTSERKEEMVTWLIGGMSGLEICVDVLDELGMAANDLSVKVYKARVQARNTADFLIYRDDILEKLHLSFAKQAY